ncbi:MAG: glycosyltransferase [Pirellulaceae bacterium]
MLTSAANASERPLRVLCCSGSLEGGGSERQLWQLTSQLDRKQFAPSVYLLYRRGHYLEKLADDVDVTAFWTEYEESRRYWPGQIRGLQIHHLSQVLRAQRIDVVYDRTFHMTLITARACRRAGIPRVSTIVSPPSSDFQHSRERFRFLKRRILASAYRDPSCVTIAVSEEVADDAAAFYRLNRSQIKVLCNPVDIEALRAAANQPINIDSKQESAAVNADMRIAVVGRLTHEKGQRLAIEALQLAQPMCSRTLHLDIIGDGPDRVQLEQLATQLGVRRQISFHGFLPNPYPWIKRSHLLCIPSKYEGLPNVALEAMCLGTAVVATNCSGSLRALIGNNERGKLVPLGDATSLAREFALASQSENNERTSQELATAWVEQHHALSNWLTSMQRILCARASAGR